MGRKARRFRGEQVFPNLRSPNPGACMSVHAILRAPDSTSGRGNRNFLTRGRRRKPV